MDSVCLTDCAEPLDGLRSLPIPPAMNDDGGIFHPGADPIIKPAWELALGIRRELKRGLPSPIDASLWKNEMEPLRRDVDGRLAR
jgi:hypothetical protein